MGGKKNALLSKLYFQSTLQTCNLNTFVFENDFEYSPFSRLISSILVKHPRLSSYAPIAYTIHTKYENALSSTF